MSCRRFTSTSQDSCNSYLHKCGEVEEGDDISFSSGFGIVKCSFLFSTSSEKVPM